MISKLSVCAIMLFCFLAKAESSLINPECSTKIQGGVDGFPWSVARPFPWNDIQGIWKISEGTTTYLKARVINSTNNRKLLNVVLIDSANCSKPVARGTGYIDFAEKNVVRAILSDDLYRYQVKLAEFDAKYLQIDANMCGDTVMAASTQIIGLSGRKPKSRGQTVDNLVPEEAEIQNAMMKKISDDLNAICKKAPSR